MKRSRDWGRAVVAAAVLAILAVPAAAQIEGWVMVVRKQGVVEARQGGSDTWSRVVAQKRLGASDYTRTGADSAAQVRMSDNSVLGVGPKTVVQVKQFILAAQQRTTQLAVEKGSVRAKVARFRGGSTFQVSTPNAVLAAQGTDFLVEVAEPGQASADDGWVQAQAGGGPVITRGAVFEGTVRMESPSTGQSAVLNPGDTAVIDEMGNLLVNPPTFPFNNAQQYSRDTMGLGDLTALGPTTPYEYSTVYEHFGNNPTGLTADSRNTSTGTEYGGPVLINPQAETTGTLIIELNSSSSPSFP